MSFPVFDILARRADLGPERVAFEDIAAESGSLTLNCINAPAQARPCSQTSV